MTTIYSKGDYRIVEIPDIGWNMEDLKGDCFTYELNPHLSENDLKIEEKNFEKMVENLGIFGYELEKWNPEIGVGWEHIDSCYGFIGSYEDEKHYIVDEFKTLITDKLL